MTLEESKRALVKQQMKIMYGKNYFINGDLEKQKKRMMGFVKDCKDTEDTKRLEYQRKQAITEANYMIQVIKDPDNNPYYYKICKKSIESGKLNIKFLQEYIKFLKTDYAEAIKEIEKELKNK